MDREGGSHGGSCYYTILGIRKDASFSDIRAAYRKLALQDFCDFMQEMISIMNNVKDEGVSLEDLQKMFADMVGSGDGMSFNVNTDLTETKKAHFTASKT
ncbi:hypothetical protein Gotri_013479 [Gossypium trilobum]|uniref:J domain-containing protein n=1 Tax=Gossypium trilobum TaxID=34281 RepID=A0A7J9DTZ6_9ROSI|nr:hypothetical protein [Gossypium trilobum]